MTTECVIFWATFSIQQAKNTMNISELVCQKVLWNSQGYSFVQNCGMISCNESNISIIPRGERHPTLVRILQEFLTEVISTQYSRIMCQFKLCLRVESSILEAVFITVLWLPWYACLFWRTGNIILNIGQKKTREEGKQKTVDSLLYDIK